jgi:hypothetical protein
MYKRADRYKQLRIFLDPNPFGGGVVLTVVARVSRGGRHRDRLLASTRLGHDLDDASVVETLRHAGEILQREAERMYESTH